MKIVMVEPGKVPYEKEISNELTGMQDTVGGLIQAIYPFQEEVALICNEEGKLLGLEPNRALRNEEGTLYDVIMGAFFLCGAPVDGEDFCSLSGEQIEHYKKLFRNPEVFLWVEEQPIVVHEPNN